jgi:hypothetical protein
MTVYKVVHFRGFVVGRDFECTQNIGRGKPTRLPHAVQMVIASPKNAKIQTNFS